MPRRSWRKSGPEAPRVVALSGHDSTPWICDAFQQTFGDRYRTMRVGEKLQIIAGGVLGEHGVVR
jgi:hypothetical protein